MNSEKITVLDLLDSPSEIRRRISFIIDNLDIKTADPQAVYFVEHFEHRKGESLKAALSCAAVARIISKMPAESASTKAMLSLQRIYQQNSMLAGRIDAATSFAEADEILKSAKEIPHFTGVTFKAIFAKALTADQKKQVLAYKCFKELYSKKVEANRKLPLMEEAKKVAGMKEASDENFAQLRGFVKRFKAERSFDNITGAEVRELNILFAHFSNFPTIYKNQVNLLFTHTGKTRLFGDLHKSAWGAPRRTAREDFR